MAGNGDRHTWFDILKLNIIMENKTDWYRKLLRKLNNIKSGRLDLDEYIDEVKAKIEAETQALSMSGVVGRSEQFCECNDLKRNIVTKWVCTTCDKKYKR